jgi:hypothetical protein
MMFFVVYFSFQLLLIFNFDIAFNIMSSNLLKNMIASC